MEAISRKGMGGLGCPDSPEGDVDYPLHDSPRNDTPHTNDNEYNSLVQNRNQMNQGGKISSTLTPLNLFRLSLTCFDSILKMKTMRSLGPSGLVRSACLTILPNFQTFCFQHVTPWDYLPTTPRYPQTLRP